MLIYSYQYSTVHSASIPQVSHIHFQFYLLSFFTNIYLFPSKILPVFLVSLRSCLFTSTLFSVSLFCKSFFILSLYAFLSLSVYLSLHTYTYISLYLPACLPINLSDHPSACLFIIISCCLPPFVRFFCSFAVVYRSALFLVLFEKRCP